MEEMITGFSDECMNQMSFMKIIADASTVAEPTPNEIKNNNEANNF